MSSLLSSPYLLRVPRGQNVYVFLGPQFIRMSSPISRNVFEFLLLFPLPPSSLSGKSLYQGKSKMNLIKLWLSRRTGLFKPSFVLVYISCPKIFFVILISGFWCPSNVPPFFICGYFFFSTKRMSRIFIFAGYLGTEANLTEHSPTIRRRKNSANRRIV